MTDKICIDDDAAAFEEWARLVNIYDSMPTIEDAFAAGLQRGKAHGAAEEREAVLAIVEAIKMTAKFGYQTDLIAKVEARIRQRGEVK